MSHGVRATDPPLTAPTQCIVLQNVCVWGGGGVCSGVGCGPRVRGATYLPRRIDRVRPKGFRQSNQGARGLVAAPVFWALPTYHGESIVCGRKGFVSQTKRKRKTLKKTAKRDVRFRFFTASTSANFISSG
jgi:hypothetical protein